MNIVGIIAEYNPFHNGHLYHLKKVKQLYPDSIIVLVLSGNFLQRGEVSIIDKWEKTKIALEYGVDIVLELPFVFATQGADIFAKGALHILNEFKVNKLIFGSETNNIELLKELAHIQINNKEYDIKVKELLQDGINYPTALSNALKEFTDYQITEPNDILALSYTREIIKNNYKINPISIKRTNDYHDLNSNNEIISASNIRNKLKDKIDIKNYIPELTYKYLINNETVNMNDYFPYLKYQIISNINNLEEFLTVDEGIENRIKKVIYKANNFEELVIGVKTKRYTYNKISRMFCHILTSFKKENNFQDIKYIRILGLNDIGRKYLNSIKKEIGVKLITKFSDFNTEEREIELKLAYIYSIPFSNDKKEKYLSDEINSKIIFKNKND